jgi:hypothetical protein
MENTPVVRVGPAIKVEHILTQKPATMNVTDRQAFANRRLMPTAGTGELK